MGVIYELNRNEKIDLTIASDFLTKDGIKGFTENMLDYFKWVYLKNIWFLNNRFLWQNGLICKFWRNNFDVVIVLANPYHISTWLFSIHQRLKGKKVIFWTHGMIKSESGLKLIIRKLFLKLSEDLMVYSEYSKSVLVKVGFDSNKVHVIYNSVYNKTEEFHLVESKNKKLKSSIDPFRLVFIGRLTKQKKLMLLLESFKALNHLGLNIELVIIGDGPLMESMSQFVLTNNLTKKVIFHGPVYDEDIIGSILSNCDLCVSPGEVGLTSIHAMQYGVPVISHGNKQTQMPEFEIIISGQTGAFFKEDDVMSLTHVMKNWIYSYKNKREVIRQNCKDQVLNKYNPKHQNLIIEEILSKYDK